ncbi:MAG: DUF1080 domain-containing protein [Candidatus Hinthialibacter antarcticus]|nr:DUF1080 domain-containing protein [Candidatus Hinthialibacter antarcticus]
MRFVLTITIVIAFSLISASSDAQTNRPTLPDPVKQTLQTQMKENFKQALTQKTTFQGKDAYYVRISRPQKKTKHVIIATDGSMLDQWISGQIRLRNGRLMRDDDPYSIRTVHTADIGDPKQPVSHVFQQFFKMSDVGGTALSFDLYGFEDNGAKLNADAVKRVQFIIGQLGNYWTGGVCRVLGPNAPQSAQGRKQAVQTAAKTFANEPSIAFWIDGPDAETLGKEFKRLAPEICVIAPGGDLDLVYVPPKESPKKTILVAGKMIETRSNVQYILAGSERDFAALEAVNKFPAESMTLKPSTNGLTKKEIEEGFVSLFDGKTLNGWSVTGGNEDGFVAKGNAIEWVETGAGALQSNKRYGDFIIRLEYRIEKNGNSGLQLRTPRNNRASRIGFEFQMLGDHGQEPNKNSTGSIYDVIPPLKNASKPSPEWNQVEITMDGPKIKAFLNGELVQDLSFDDYDELKYRLRKGFIRLTDHNNYVAFRNIRIKEL